MFKRTSELVIAVTITAVAVIAIMLFANREPNVNAAAQKDVRTLVLTSKAELKSEPGQWTFAPDVPPPITRKEQRRVKVNWSIKETQAEIAPGVIYDDYWAFEGKVPGPLLRVREGDLVEVHLTNDIRSGRGHNIDFHFVSGPGVGASALDVAPGQTAVLEARAMAPGLYMFHCASPDIPTHIANGMYGYVLVEPAEGLPSVGKELYVVQSEIYAKSGEKGHQQFSMERGEKMDAQYVLFNGAVGAMLKDRAPRVPIDQPVRLYVGNAGPNYISSFHVIGQIFDKVYREGDLISPPGLGIQTTLIPAGGSAVVEFTSRVPGTFLLDHAIFRLHAGAVGSVVVSGDQNAEVFEPITARSTQAMSADAHTDGLMRPIEPEKHDYVHAGPIPPASDPAVTALIAATNAAMLREMKPAAGTIEIMNGAGNFDKDPENDYWPKVLNIKRGTTVRFVNRDIVVHNFKTSKGKVESPLLKPNEEWTYTFKKPGVYPFVCVPHPWMQGKIIVK